MKQRALIAAAVLVILCLGLGYSYYRYQTRDLEIDQEAAEALAAQMLPGARPLQGSKGIASLKRRGLRIALLAPSLAKINAEHLEGDELRVAVLGLPQGSGPAAVEELQNRATDLAAELQLQGFRRLEADPATLQIGGHPQPALRTVSQKGDGRAVLEFHTIFSHEGRPALLSIAGPVSTFSMPAMQKFLDGLTVQPGLPEGFQAPASRPGVRANPGVNATSAASQNRNTGDEEPGASQRSSRRGR